MRMVNIDNAHGRLSTHVHSQSLLRIRRIYGNRMMVVAYKSSTVSVRR